MINFNTILTEIEGDVWETVQKYKVIAQDSGSYYKGPSPTKPYIMKRKM